MVGLFQHFKVYHHVARKEYPVLYAVLLHLVILQTVTTSIHIVLGSFTHSLQSTKQLYTELTTHAPVLVPAQQCWCQCSNAASLNRRRPCMQNYQ